MYKRIEFNILARRVAEPRRFIQVVVGPRQVGKTTLVKQVLDECAVPHLHFSADNVPASGSSWIADCWDTARARMAAGKEKEFLLVIDEIQKIAQWSEVVKREWDADTWNGVGLKVILLGSSRVLLEKGLSESLAGRFEEIRMTHWSYKEMNDAFGMSLDEYVFYGGYPGAVGLTDDADRWENYIGSAIVDATINKDILQNQVVTKPALLRQAFELGSSYSSRELSLNKLMGELQDAGNTTTLSSYFRMLSDSGMLTTLHKFAVNQARKRASAPKFQVYNNALRAIYNDYSFAQALENRRIWGMYFESAIGAHIVCRAFTDRYDAYYWRDGNNEVDYVIQKKDKVVAIEVKSNDESSSVGIEAFKKKFNPYRVVVVGKNALPAEEFLSINPADLFE